MVPFSLLKFRPVGRVPLISQEVIAPGPTKFGVRGRIPELFSFLVSTSHSWLYPMSVGTWSTTVTLNIAIDEPPELFAQTVYCVLVHSSVAIP